MQQCHIDLSTVLPSPSWKARAKHCYQGEPLLVSFFFSFLKALNTGLILNILWFGGGFFNALLFLSQSFPHHLPCLLLPILSPLLKRGKEAKCISAAGVTHLRLNSQSAFSRQVMILSLLRRQDFSLCFGQDGLQSSSE